MPADVPSSRSPLHARVRAPLVVGWSAQLAVVDVVVRGTRGLAHHPCAPLGWLASVALWWLLGSLSRRRVARASVAVALATLLVVDGAVYRYYHTLFDAQVLATALHGWSDTRPIVVRLLPAGLLAIAAVSALEYAWLSLAKPSLRLGSRAILFGVMLLAAAPLARADLTPDLRAIAALSVVTSPRRAAATTRAHVPELSSTRDEVPSVVLIVTESVRAESYCSEPRDDCPFSPEVNALLPARVPLRQLRSVASYTALSVASLLTGQTLADGRDPDAPTLFDYVHATRVDGRPVTVAYWSAQAATVMERDVSGSVDSLITLETLLGHGVADEDDAVLEDMDRRLIERAIVELPRLPRPFFLMLHLLGTHAPYFIDPARAPFQPTERVVTWAGLPALQNAYLDSIVAQDHTLATFLRAFIAHEQGAPWLVLFTSDHGEAFGEHGAIHHGQNLYDEQIHVPGWVAAGDGALGDEQRANLASHERAFTTHLDLVPTVLDAFGALGSLGMTSLRPRLAGSSLLAQGRALAPLPMTNCTSMFPCPLDTWGMLGEGHALVAQPWDGAWNCVDLVTRTERSDGAACDALRAASRSYFPRLPGGQANELHDR